MDAFLRIAIALVLAAIVYVNVRSERRYWNDHRHELDGAGR